MLCINCDILSPNILMWWSRTMQKRPEKKKHMHLNWHALASHFWCWKFSEKKTSTWDVTLQIIAPWFGANRPWLLGGTDPENHQQTLTPKSWCLFLREGAVLVEWQFFCLHRHSRSRRFGVECGVTTLVELENMVDATQLMLCKAVARNLKKKKDVSLFWELAFGTFMNTLT